MRRLNRKIRATNFVQVRDSRNGPSKLQRNRSVETRTPTFHRDYPGGTRVIILGSQSRIAHIPGLAKQSQLRDFNQCRCIVLTGIFRRENALITGTRATREANDRIEEPSPRSAHVRQGSWELLSC